MLHILTLFTEERPSWSAVDLIGELNTSRATGYRYIKTLYEAGLLATVRKGRYSLGPRIMEMDLQIRRADPFLLAGAGVLQELTQETGKPAVLLTAVSDETVLCIGEHRSPEALAEPSFRGRGHRSTLFEGAGAKVILAHFPYHRLQLIYPRQAQRIHDAGLGRTWRDFRNTLAVIKQEGVHMSMDQGAAEVCEVAAPVMGGRLRVAGSIGVMWTAGVPSDVELQAALTAVRRAAKCVSVRLQNA